MIKLKASKWMEWTSYLLLVWQKIHDLVYILLRGKPFNLKVLRLFTDDLRRYLLLKKLPLSLYFLAINNYTFFNVEIFFWSLNIHIQRAIFFTTKNMLEKSSILFSSGLLETKIIILCILKIQRYDAIN